ncbi:SAV_6107 family HEPN domain-containing protein [Qaidamihabitans albus]|uniref:SAV_6107 family HEPN domain-containing protein n=1 Tax=Qaidamihabitans albus TaxID=2795733 RepID=UPI0018F115FB|nr:SAV_6107 family HEPN domain-containing protein [Qaidamihabitans albus]
MSVVFASRNGSVQPALPIELRPPAVPAAVSLLAQAGHGLAEARREADPVSRFVGSYLSALRAAAAVLAARGRPHRGRARPESVWTLLESAAPELAEWAAFFAANSAKRAAAQAGITRAVTVDSADELFLRASEFVALARRVVHGTSAARVSRCDVRPRARKRRER